MPSLNLKGMHTFEKLLIYLFDFDTSNSVNLLPHSCTTNVRLLAADSDEVLL